MSDHDDGIDEARAERITKNIDLAFRFLEEVIDDPVRLDQMPSGATVVVDPNDDPDLTAERLIRAQELSATGRQTYLWRLGAPPGERSAFAVRTLTPHWPTEGIDPVAQYDHEQDLLIVDFFNGRRPGIQIPSKDYGVLFIDPETEEIVAHVLPRFLDRVVRRDPALIDVLLRPETTLRGITRADVETIRNELAHRGPVPASFATITERLQVLTA